MLLIGSKVVYELQITNLDWSRSMGQNCIKGARSILH